MLFLIYYDINPTCSCLFVLGPSGSLKRTTPAVCGERLSSSLWTLKLTVGLNQSVPLQNRKIDQCFIKSDQNKSDSMLSRLLGFNSHVHLVTRKN